MLLCFKLGHFLQTCLATLSLLGDLLNIFVVFFKTISGHPVFIGRSSEHLGLFSKEFLVTLLRVECSEKFWSVDFGSRSADLTIRTEMEDLPAKIFIGGKK
jgi:hypothetical protein